jgi:hypothetical protein
LKITHLATLNPINNWLSVLLVHSLQGNEEMACLSGANANMLLHMYDATRKPYQASQKNAVNTVNIHLGKIICKVKASSTHYVLGLKK